MSRAVFPGSFDPVTLGHLHLIRRAARLYDEVIVVIAVNSQKHALFTAEERRALIEENIRGMGNVRVDTAVGTAGAQGQRAGRTGDHSRDPR